MSTSISSPTSLSCSNNSNINSSISSGSINSNVGVSSGVCSNVNSGRLPYPHGVAVLPPLPPYPAYVVQSSLYNITATQSVTSSTTSSPLIRK